MAYTDLQSQCDMPRPGMSSCTTSGSTLYADTPINEGIGAFPLSITGLAPSYDHSLSERYLEVFGKSGTDFEPYSLFGALPFGFHGNAVAQLPYYGYQTVLPEPFQHNAAMNIDGGMTSYPEYDLQIHGHAVSRSNKIKEKIRNLHPFYSRRLMSAAPQEGRTRTRDKYRVVYTEKQRIGLEVAYKEDKFITMTKKADLSKSLGLSDRQIKIWFQNRRAKERRDERKSTKPNTTSPEQKKVQSSCRFENENIRHQNHQDTAALPSLQSITQAGLPVSGYGDCEAYDQSTMTQNAHQKLTGAEVTSKYQEMAHARFQMSPSDWMGAYHQPLMPTVNISPFTSSINYVHRT